MKNIRTTLFTYRDIYCRSAKSWLWLVSFWCLLLIATSCTPCTEQRQMTSSTATFQYKAPDAKPILYIPGMNNSPDVVASLAKELAARGFQTSGLTLPGHFGTDRTIAPGDWRKSVLAALRTLETPTTIVAYSLGALSLLEALDEAPDSKVDRIVLLAPPLRLRTWVTMTGRIAGLFPRTWCVPSMAPRRYRLHRCVPLAWYEESSRMAKALTSNQIKANFPFPVTVILSSGDEAIDSNETASWISEYHPEWKVTIVQPRSELPETFNHFLPDPRSMGSTAWHKIIELIGANP